MNRIKQPQEVIGISSPVSLTKVNSIYELMLNNKSQQRFLMNKYAM